MAAPPSAGDKFEWEMLPEPLFELGFLCFRELLFKISLLDRLVKRLIRIACTIIFGIPCPVVFTAELAQVYLDAQ